MAESITFVLTAVKPSYQLLRRRPAIIARIMCYVIQEVSYRTDTWFRGHSGVGTCSSAVRSRPTLRRCGLRMGRPPVGGVVGRASRRRTISSTNTRDSASARTYNIAARAIVRVPIRTGRDRGQRRWYTHARDTSSDRPSVVVVVVVVVSCAACQSLHIIYETRDDMTTTTTTTTKIIIIQHKHVRL